MFDPHYIFLIYLGALLSSLAVIFFQHGFNDYDDDTLTCMVLMAFVWPCVVAFFLIVGPFWLLFKAGQRIGDMKYKERKEERERWAAHRRW